MFFYAALLYRKGINITVVLAAPVHPPPPPLIAVLLLGTTFTTPPTSFRLASINTETLKTELERTLEQVKCLECKQKMDNTETICPHCGWVVDQEALAEAKDRKDKKDSILLLLLFFGGTLGTMILLSFVYPK